MLPWRLEARGAYPKKLTPRRGLATTRCRQPLIDRPTLMRIVPGFQDGGLDPSYATVPRPSGHLWAHLTAPSRNRQQDGGRKILLVLI
jgi:hypothetical protein